MAELSWAVLTPEDLDVPTLYDVLRLRAAVFVVDQDCAYQDVDGADLSAGARHVVGTGPDGLAAYARVLAPGAERPAPRIGRVVTAASARGLGLGRAVVTRAVTACEETWPGLGITLEAQAHLRSFYEGLGFAVVGEPYDEDGIPHLPMRRGAPDDLR